VSQQTLSRLIQAHGQIRIPMLQRDFAQGRASAATIRVRFVTALRDALVQRQPLDLDFVYGVVGVSGQEGFAPLDGQQRLTTLFLLHWYLAQHDGAVDAFQALARQEKSKRSRFTYAVRPSSGEFFDALVNATVSVDTAPRLSAALRDAQWFFQSWERDPTVVSCLSVLDTIDDLFRGTSGLYERLTDDTAPTITFQFLDLESFGLTDDLYIKMNARGKALTGLETFKANLEQHIQQHHAGLRVGSQSLQAHLSHAFDTRWADLFWSPDDPLAFDAHMMNAIRAVALLAWSGTEDTLQMLSGDAPLSFYDYRDRGCLSAAFLTSLVALLDKSASSATMWQSGTRIDGEALIQRVLSGEGSRSREGMTYQHWLLFVAWCEHHLSPHPASQRDQWLRVIANLVENTTYNRLSEFAQAIQTIRVLIRAPNILSALRDPATDLRGFNRQQVREERLKAHLMAKSPAWGALITSAEDHPYFRGQIEFLFSFSGILSAWQSQQDAGWSDEQDTQHRTRFSDWWARTCAVFPPSQAGLFAHKKHRWRRALLCEGDYLLQKGRNHSLLEDIDRDVSWKRLLRGHLDAKDEANTVRDTVRRVLKRIDVDNVEKSLRAIIKEGLVAPEDDGWWGWRSLLIQEPVLFDYMLRNMVRFEDSTVYLLKRLRRSGKHWDLFLLWLCSRLDGAKTDPFDILQAPPVSGSSEHHTLTLRSDSHNLICLVSSSAGVFHASLIRGSVTVESWSFPHAGARKRIKDICRSAAALLAGEE